MSAFNESDFLLLSGIQHMAFCQRQWGLIHIEQIWVENVRTVEGRQLHERTDDPFEYETRKDLRIVRAMPLVSELLGLRGVADVVEFHKEACPKEGFNVKLAGRNGWWRPFPVEYKVGRPKPDDRDAVQLCAQAIALEEMFGISVQSGALYYGQTRHRKEVTFDDKLRLRVVELAQKMHELMEKGITPRATKGKRCSICSLVEKCQPNLMIRHKSVKKYLKSVALEVDGN